MYPWLLMQSATESEISASTDFPWECTGDIEVTSNLVFPWEGKGSVAGATTVLYESLADVSTSPSIPWETIDGTVAGTVTSDLTFEWESLVSRSVVYEIEARIWRDITITVEVS